MQEAHACTGEGRRMPRVCAYLLAACAAACTALAPSPAQAKPVPGSNGDVKVHRTTTPVDDQREDPKVCEFYLDAFHFDTLQSVTWHIDHQPAKPPGPVLSGAITLTNGTGSTTTLALPNGMYKLFWHFQGETGADKHKVFKVDCPPNGGGTGGGTGGASGGGSGGGNGGGGIPGGGVEAGLGGTHHASPLGEIGAAVLLAGSSFLIIRRIRRRLGDHAR